MFYVFSAFSCSDLLCKNPFLKPCNVISKILQVLGTILSPSLSVYVVQQIFLQMISYRIRHYEIPLIVYWSRAIAVLKMLGALSKLKVIETIDVSYLAIIDYHFCQCLHFFTSDFEFSDMESARCPQPKIPSPTSSAASKGDLKVSSVNEKTTNIQETADDRKAVSAPQQTSEQVRNPRAADISEATHESMSVKEPASQGSAQQVEEEVQQKLVPTEAGNIDSYTLFFLNMIWHKIGR